VKIIGNLSLRTTFILYTLIMLFIGMVPQLCSIGFKLTIHTSIFLYYYNFWNVYPIKINCSQQY
jgi:hypothetical protein